MPKGFAAPHPQLKSLVRTLPLQMPFLEGKPAPDGERSLSAIDELLARENLWLDQEQARKHQWEYLKLFRTKYDNEFNQTESILSQPEILAKKKELDKAILDSVRLCIINEE
mmetsp:Transcript_25413/g.19156  ORF Transcript_25413/g.19156 Transcript_25413/m.19156 type:complete len:112 (+) Transcript_25413:788-1123(+)